MNFLQDVADNYLANSQKLSSKSKVGKLLKISTVSHFEDDFVAVETSAINLDSTDILSSFMLIGFI